jgi:hypothetical protein
MYRFLLLLPPNPPPQAPTWQRRAAPGWPSPPQPRPPPHLSSPAATAGSAVGQSPGGALAAAVLPRFGVRAVSASAIFAGSEAVGSGHGLCMEAVGNGGGGVVVQACPI